MKTTTTTVSSWGAVTPQDESLTYRVVGNLEYISALRNLDAFLKNATQEEIQAADEIVKSRPQFAVFSQLAERFRPGNAPPAAGTTGSADSKSQSRFPERRGLMWVVALARLEAGAIIGTFTTIPAPFEVVGPTEYEMPAYKELLMDGAQMHFWGLANDSHLPDVTKSIPGTEMLAYLRRLNLARKMLSAAVRSNAKELTPPQWTQVVEQDQKLLELRDGFEATITAYVISLNRVSQSSSSNTSKVNSVGACGAQLAGERAELRAGTASVQTFDVK